MHLDLDAQLASWLISSSTAPVLELFQGQLDAAHASPPFLADDHERFA